MLSPFSKSYLKVDSTIFGNITGLACSDSAICTIWISERPVLFKCIGSASLKRVLSANCVDSIHLHSIEQLPPKQERFFADNQMAFVVD